MLARSPLRPLLILLLVCSASRVIGQGLYPLQITTTVSPPYTQELASYFGIGSNISFQITNTSTQTYYIYINGSIADSDGSASVTVPDDVVWSGNALEVQPGMWSYPGSALSDIVQSMRDHAILYGLDTDLLDQGIIPEGIYEICLRAFDYNNPGTPLSAQGPSGCATVVIREAEPPEPLNPTCWGDGSGEMVTPQVPQLINFQWILPGGIPAMVNISYRFRLVRIDNPSNAQAALETSTDVVYEEEVMTNILSYNQSYPALERGRMYAWWVQAIADPSNVMSFRNNGFMRPCTFTYQDHDNTGFTLAYPMQQDTLPWDLMPLITTFDPHAPATDEQGTTGRFYSILHLSKNGEPLPTVYRQGLNDELNWAQGYFHSQQQLLGNPAGFTEDHARHINIYTNDPTPDQRFERGATYTISADLRTKTTAGTDVRYGDVEGVFVAGMGRPKPLSPQHNAVLPRDGGDEELDGFAPVPLRFKTAESPIALTPPFPIWIIPSSGAASQTQGSAHERWRLEVSRAADMSNPVYSNTNVYGPVPLRMDSCDGPCLEAFLYREETVSFTPGDTGKYYWRVAWMKDPSSAVGPTYHEGPVRMFRILGDGTPPPNEEPERPRECVSVCRATATPFNMQVPAMVAAVGDTVSIGLFDLRITSITWTGGSAIGDGLINVPFMNCPMKVSFNQAHINEQKMMFNGDVYGKYDEESFVPAGWRMGAGLAGGFSPAAVRTIDDLLNGTGRLVNQLDGNTPMGLPIGISTDVPGGRFTVGVVGMRFTDTVATMNAMMSVPMPELDFNFGLGVSDQVFQPDGVGCPDKDALLYLVDDVRIGIGGDTLVVRSTRFEPGNMINVLDSGTFAAWDCRGFRALQLDAEWRFSRDHLMEDKPDGSSGPNKIVASLKTRTGRGGFMGRVDFNKPFHIEGIEGWGFDVQEAWMDLASYANPPNMNLTPAVAERIGLVESDGSEIPTWRGFYLKRAMLRLPNEVKRFGSTERVTGIVDDLVIIGSQVTASFKLVNLIGENEGDMAGWAISLDTLQFDIASNSFAQAGIKGRIRTAASPTLLAYSGMLRQSPTMDRKWLEFIIQPQNNLTVPFLYSTIDLEETSTVVAALGDPTLGTYAKATLHGSLNLNVPAGPVTLDFSGIEFQDLWFSTSAPYTSIGGDAVFSFASPQKYMGAPLDDDDAAPLTPGGNAGGFPVSITGVTGERSTIDGKPAAGIAYDINLNLTDNTNIFLATTRITTLGVLNTTEIHQWGGHEMQLDSIGVDGGVGAVHVVGGLKWYRDSPTFGNGIKGSLTALFMNGAVEVTANAQFGTVGANKYWYVDAMAARDGGFNRPSPFTIYGFGGAAWYHMRQTGAPPLASSIVEQELANITDPDFEPGLTLSGLSFVPDPAVGFGFKATMVFGDPSTGYAYNGDVSAGAQFTADGGILNIFLDGNMYVMYKRQDGGHIPVRGNGRIEYDFPNDVFSARFDMFVHLVASSGIDVLYGNGNNKKAGSMEMLITPDSWHIYIGTPADRVGLTFVDFISGNFYFMIGDDLPPVPAPPAAVANIVPASYLVREDIGDASGVAFGAGVPLAVKDKWLIFGYHVVGEVGFDLMFRVAPVACMGETNPGIGPFYVNGQLYGYMDAGVSITVDVSIFSGEFHLFDVGLAGLFQCGFANPSWLSGTVYGSYNILHGMVKGSVSLPFRAGTPCQPPNQDILNGLDPIGDLSPADLSGLPPSCSDAKVCGVDCGTMPEAVFNMKVGQSFTMHEMRSNGTWFPRTFKLEIDHFELRKKSTSSLIAGTTTMAANKEMATLGPNAYLEPNTEFTVSIRLRAEELKNGVWERVKKNGQDVTWTMKHTIKTNTGIEELSANDVAWSYPFLRQRFLLQDECRKGIIDCKASLADQPVFKAPPGRSRSYRVLFIPITGGAAVERDVTVSHTDTTSVLSFDIPQLQNSKTYTLKVVARDQIDASTMGISGDGPSTPSPNTPQGIAQGLLNTQVQNTGTASVGNSVSSSFQGMVNIHRRSLQGYTLRPDEKLIYEYQFRNSQYNTLGAKAAALANSSTNYVSTTHMPPRETLEPAFTGEGFDTYDANGLPYTRNSGSFRIEPMVFLTAANSETWMTNWAKPVLYDYYGLIKTSGCSDLQLARNTIISNFGFIPTMLIQDTPDTVGIPPYRTVRFHPNGLVWSALSDSEAAPSIGSGTPGSIGGINSISDGSSPPQTLLQVTTGMWTRNDYIRLKTITDDLIVRCGPVNPTIDGQGEAMGGLSEPLRSKVLAFQNGYRLMYKGNYRTTFWFVPPPTCPNNYVEQGDPMLNTGSSGNAVYNHALGSTPPVLGAPVGPPGGMIQN